MVVGEFRGEGQGLNGVSSEQWVVDSKHSKQ